MVDIKDSVARLYVKRFVIPKALIFNKPGFVDFKISGKTTILLRQIMFPESFFVNLEKELVTKFGAAGKKAMYSVGKKFGYSFAQNGRFENIKDHPGDGVKDWVMIASKFVEGTYATNISQQTDVSQKRVDYELLNFAVCRKLGYDYFLASGGAAGIIAWILQDKGIEGYLYDSKFEGENQKCKVMCAPVSVLSKNFKDEIYTEQNLDGLDEDAMTYQSFNREVDIQYKKSFETFLNAKTFSYAGGIILYKGHERFFLVEVSGMYLLELGMTNPQMKQILFDTAFNTGQQMFPEISNKDITGVLELLSALGWGEVLMLPAGNKIRVVISHFPWTKFYRDITFDLIRGLLSGIFTKAKGKKVIFGPPKADILKGHLTLVLEVEG